MNHPDEGRLQAFLDEELPPEERARVAEHLLTCAGCRATRDELARANAVFSEAVAALDVAEPRRSAPVLEGRRFRSGSLVKAAALILLVAAAASAAVPGSPVREWIVDVVEPEPPVAEMEPVEAPPAEPPVPVGVSIRPETGVTIVLRELEGSIIRLVETAGERVSVSAIRAETDPVFSTSAGRIEVRGGVGGEVVIELPRSLAAARVLVDGQVYAVKEAGELQAKVAADVTNGALIWR